MKQSASFFLFFCLLVFTAAGHAQTATTIQYQGTLFDSSGAPVTGNKAIVFRIFDKSEPEDSETSLWQETLAVDISDGFFTAMLGTIVELSDDLFKESELWVELEISGETLSPRQPVSAVPWARRAFSVEGPVEATTITSDGPMSIGDSEVVNADGQWVGSISIESNEFECSGCVDKDDLAQKYYTTDETYTRDEVDTAIEEAPPKLAPGQTYNLSWFRTSDGVITIKGADGSDLTSENPGYVSVPSTDIQGGWITLAVPENHQFHDAGHAQSNLEGWTFGVTGGVVLDAWIPIGIYAIRKDNNGENLRFGFSRSPTIVKTGSSELLGNKNDEPTTSDQNNVFIIGEDTPSDYASCPSILIGGAMMIKPSYEDDWQIIGSSYRAGIGPIAIDYTFSTTYAFTTGQNGAFAGSFFSVQSQGCDGTNDLPTWTPLEKVQYKFTLNRAGIIDISFTTTLAESMSNGDCEGKLALILPYLPIGEVGGGNFIIPIGRAKIGGTDKLVYGAYSNVSYPMTLFSDAGDIKANMFTESSDNLNIKLHYKAF